MDSNIIAICLAAVCLLYNQAAGNESEAKDADGNTICYGDLGCFGANNSIFNLKELPSSPETIDTKFRLFTRENKEDTKFQMLMVEDDNSIANSNFDHSKPTKMVVHGFLHNGLEPWMMKMKNELLKAGDFNVILIDWGNGAKIINYNLATVNARVVGAVLAKFITMLTEQVGANPEDFHIIGHSLGAHVSGYAGERIPNLGRITGLDPAGPNFKEKNKVVRLDPTDAKFVDVIHTDTRTLLGYGMPDPVGHVDYYPNGGVFQPDCYLLICRHLRAIVYFTESINSACPFHGYRCKSNENFKQGICMPCYNEGCGFMGFHADRAKPSGNATLVTYFLETGGSEPFCRYHYQITMSFLNVSGSKTEKGQIMVNLMGSNGELLEPHPTPMDMDIEPGRKHVIIVKSINYIGEVTNATMSWHQKSGTGNIYIEHLEIVSGISPGLRILCSKDAYVGPGVTVYFARKA